MMLRIPTQVHTGVKTPFEPPVCNVTRFSVPARPANGTRPAAAGCGHEVFLVKPAQTYLFRLINGATMAFITICFEGHSVEILNVDTTPAEGIDFPNGCIDLGSGQRWVSLAGAGGPKGRGDLTSRQLH